jgi:DNA-directed RNA polymerase specialized sigma24 family protein
MKIKKSRLMQIIQEEISRMDEVAAFRGDAPGAAAAEKTMARIRKGGMLGDRLTKQQKEEEFKVLNDPSLPYDARESAFGALVSDFSARFAERYGKKSSDDVQNAFVQALEYFMNKGGTLESAKFGTWLNSVADKRFIDAIQKFGRERPFAGSAGRPGEASIGDVSDASQDDTVYTRPPVAYIPNPDQALMRKEREGAFGDLMTAIETGEIQMSDNEKAVLLNQLDDDPKSATELAAELELERATSIGSLSSRARQKISKWLDSTNADAKTRKKIKELLSGIVSGGESLEETIKAAIMEMIDEGAIEGLDEIKKKDQDDLENEKAIRKGEIPKPGYKFPKSHDDGPVGNRIKGLEEESIEETIAEAIKNFFENQ